MVWPKETQFCFRLLDRSYLNPSNIKFFMAISTKKIYNNKKKLFLACDFVRRALLVQIWQVFFEKSEIKKEVLPPTLFWRAM